MSVGTGIVDSRIVLPDIHVPYHDTKAVAAIEHYMTWRQSRTSHVQRLNGWIQLGDLGDFDSVSRHNIGRRKLQEGLRVQADFDACTTLLDRHQNIMGDTASFDLIEGNHEDRLNRYAEEHPEIDGLLTVPRGLDLAARGIRWWPFWSRGHRGGILKVGKAHFGHGRYTSGFHAKKHALVYGDNFFYGHVHDTQSHTHPFVGENRVVAAESFGCLCDLNRDWMQGSPDKWQHAFAVFNWLRDGTFGYSLVRIFRGRFVSPEGEVFTHRGRVASA